MIIRSRRRKERWFTRILTGKIRSQSNYAGLLSPAEFHRELAKEASRSSRRKQNPEFVLITTNILVDEIEAALINELRSQVRISDSVGVFDNKLSILCPETDREGGLVVANQVSRSALELDIHLETEVLVYPWDDSIANQSKYLPYKNKKEMDSLDSDDSTGGLPANDEAAAEADLEAAGVNAEARVSLDQETLLARQSMRSAEKLVVPFESDLPTPLWKRMTDIVISGSLLVATSPVLLLAAVAIKSTSSGPIFYRQEREGKDGRKFFIWKFRTMVADADEQKDRLRAFSEQNGPAFKIANDPRVTPVGRYLRKSCVDELPQLWNVLMGDMSLVGPRPLPVDESLECQPWHRKRLLVLPGLTCIWQIEGGRETKFEDWMRMDMRYLDQRSFIFDLKLITKTAVVAILHRGSV